MNVLLFIIALIVSFIAVRIGAIAFELTGLDWSMATFQSLSCFSGTGFTTRESELITGNTQRRKIASVLMIVGNVGLVTMIATFANSLRPEVFASVITIPFLHFVFPSNILPWINLGIILVSALIIVYLAVHTNFDRRLTDFLRRRIVKKEIIKPVSFEYLIVATGGYGITKIEVSKESPVVNKSLIDSGLREQDITVLAIEKDGVLTPNPPANTKILLGNYLICFGKLGEMRKKICAVC